MSWYRGGSIALTINSANVTGSLTVFQGNVFPGEAMLGPDGKIYEIATVTSNTQLTLGKPYEGASGAGQSYLIVPVQGYIKDLAQSASTLVYDLQNKNAVVQSALNTKAPLESPVFTGVASLPYDSIFRKLGGAEGGQLRLEKPVTGSALTGDLVIDVVSNALRIFDGVSTKGVFVDLTAAPTGVGAQIYHTSFKPSKADVGLSSVDNTPDAAKSIGGTAKYGLVGSVVSGDANLHFASMLPGSTSIVEGTTVANAPTADWIMLESIRHTNSTNLWGVQYAHGWEGAGRRLWVRFASGGVWSTWKEMQLRGDSVLSPESTGILGALGAGTPTFEVRNVLGVGNAAYMQFHRQEAFAVRFGLDTDNKLKIGGWTMGSAAYEILNQNNLAGYLASPYAIGQTTPATGAFTALTSTVTATDGRSSLGVTRIHNSTVVEGSIPTAAQVSFVNTSTANRLSAQAMRINYTHSGSGIPTAFDTVVDVNATVNENLNGTLYGAMFEGVNVAAGKTLHTYVAINLAAPTGTGAVGRKNAIIVQSGAGNVLLGTNVDDGANQLQVAGGLKVVSGMVHVNDGINITAPSSGLELGSTSVANTPFIDFHSSGTLSDFDARIIAVGGTAASGQGGLQFEGALHNFFGAVNVKSTVVAEANNVNGVDLFYTHNTSTASVNTKFAGYQFRGTDTVGAAKETGSFRAYPADINYVGSYLSWRTRASNVINESMRLYDRRLVVGNSFVDDGFNALQVNGTLRPGIYTVATLPTTAPENSIAATSNGRKVGQAAGAGNGVPVYFSAGAWRVFSTDAPVTA